MASEEEQLLLTPTRRTTILRWPSIPKPSTPYASKSRTKRRKLPTVRLGGNRRKRGGFSLVGVFRRTRLRWLRLRYSSMIKRIKGLYSSIVKDLIKAGTTIEEVQRRIMFETYFTVPVIGIGAAGVPSHLVTQRT
ncbi:hypothetical protein CKAN_02523700 [Cinnamomum micranthum f. kanehirae]|uniref:Uncharacterized protein n=1 Tax=Cinnamomum micranthum f. kanehirae TaxID=337451 RepID=A0A3S3NWL3_9MAGN|nr:hypothetical protein CKAN_02523700 [Cinnamomum micranthum f. kanehirae]